MLWYFEIQKSPQVSTHVNTSPFHQLIQYHTNMRMGSQNGRRWEIILTRNENTRLVVNEETLSEEPYKLECEVSEVGI